MSVERNEPVLLVGETGTGKTSSVQFLAHQCGEHSSYFCLIFFANSYIFLILLVSAPKTKGYKLVFHIVFKHIL